MLETQLTIPIGVMSRRSSPHECCSAATAMRPFGTYEAMALCPSCNQPERMSLTVYVLQMSTLHRNLILASCAYAASLTDLTHETNLICGRAGALHSNTKG